MKTAEVTVFKTSFVNKYTTRTFNSDTRYTSCVFTFVPVPVSAGWENTTSVIANYQHCDILEG